jgi:tetratricopeptide (TPR) repeat protein
MERAIGEVLQIGWMHHQSGRLADAERLYREALRSDPTNTDALNLIAGIALTRGDAETAVRFAKRATARGTANPVPWNTLGLAQSASSNIEEARVAYRRALQLDASFAPAHNNLGGLLLQNGEPEMAIRHFETARSFVASFPDASFNEAFARLLLGDFAKGWPLYESRRAMLKPEVRAIASSMQCPEWHGEELDGHTILLLKEQGFGDQIQFLRFAALLQDRGALVDVLVDTSLAKLASSARGVRRALTDPNQIPCGRYQYWSFLGSVPGIMQLDADTIPRSTPYLASDPRSTQRWQAQIDEFAGDRFRLGLVWSGSTNFRFNANRSFPIGSLDAILALDNLAMVSFQKGPQTRDLAGGRGAGASRILDLGSGFEDFSDTAAALSCVDLLLTVDTSVAHLAGALGTNTWTLLSLAPDWRWLRDGESALWYPSVRLFRQTKLHQWDDPLRLVHDELKEIVVSSRRR